MTYEVQHFTLCDGWINCWTIENPDGSTELEYFDSFEQALEYLDGFLEDEQMEYEAGNIESPYERDEFRIVKLEEGYTCPKFEPAGEYYE